MGLLDGVATGLLGDVADAADLPTLSFPSLPTLSLPGFSLPGLPTLFPTSSPSSIASATSAGPSLPTSSPVSSSLPLSLSSISTLSPSSTVPPPTSTLPSTTALQDVTSTGPNGVVRTYTNVVTVIPSASQSATAAPVHNKSFLQNKALSGTVFALVGVLALVLIITAATFVIRRRARNRLLDDAVSFDPALLAAADNAEKGHSSSASLGTMGSGRPMVPAYGNYHTEPVQQYPEYYGAPQGVQQPYYSAYVPPMADTRQDARAAQQHIPRVPVPLNDLPAEFVPESSHEENRKSIEESEFWARTLKVINE